VKKLGIVRGGEGGAPRKIKGTITVANWGGFAQFVPRDAEGKKGERDRGMHSIWTIHPFLFGKNY